LRHARLRRPDRLGFHHPERIAGLTPGLATEWKIDDGDHTRWIFTLRDGVKFHDGTDVTVDAVVWNLQRFYDDKSPQFDAAASAIVRSFVNMVDHWEKIDERHLAIYTKAPFSFFPYMVPTMLKPYGSLNLARIDVNGSYIGAVENGNAFYRDVPP
jgi:ABC-type transport system substrate-binding protein